MYKVLLTLGALCLFTGAWAQNQPNTGIISGSLQDSISHEKLAFTTVSIINKVTGKEVKGTQSDEKGNFSFTDLKSANYKLIISAIGYETKLIDGLILNNNNNKTSIDLKIIVLKPTATKLKEVTVSTQQNLIKQDLDKITYNVEADPDSKSNNALEMLRKVPMVTVDGDDNVQVKGSTSFRIHINGKPSSLFAHDTKEALKNLPAATIKSIELITNPGAKYDAEGVGGIINIITTQSLNGYSSSVNAGYDSKGRANGGLYATVKIGKLGFSGSSGFGDWNNPMSQSNSFRQNFIADQQLQQIGTSKNNGKYHYGSGELSFEINKYNLISGSCWFNGNNNKFNTQQLVSNTGANDLLLEKFMRNNSSQNTWNGGDFGLDYQKTFKDSSEHILTLSYKLSNYGRGSNSDFGNQDIFNSVSNSQRSDNNASESEHTFQIDYVHPINKKQSLEGGLKTIFRRNVSDYESFTQNGDAFILNPTNSNNFNYNQNIYSVYSSYAYKFKNVGIKIGGRIEKTATNASFSTSSADIGNDDLNFMPSLNLSLQLKGTQKLGLSYSRRIERPGIWYLNPYVDSTDRKNISYGNPSVEPSQSHSFEVSYNNFIKGSSINATLYYRFGNNAIEGYAFLKEGILNNTYGNIGKRNNLGLSLNGSTQLGNKLNLSANTNIEYTNAEAVNSISIKNEGFNFNIYGYGSYKIIEGLKFNANIGYYAPRVTLQGKSGGWMWSNFSINKEFLKKKASVNLSVAQPWESKRRSFSETRTDEFYNTNENFYVQRFVRVGFNYRLGKMDLNIAKKKRGINNDDVSKGGSSSGGGN